MFLRPSSFSFKQRLVFLYAFLFAYLLVSLILLIGRSSVFPVLLSLGSLAFFFGIKHALDADHIAAIDNTTRKLMNDGKKPIGVGFFFSLGHSLAVFILTIITVVIGKFVVKAYPELGNLSNVIGTGVSALFLYLIAFMNAVILISIIKIARDFKNFKNKKIEDELLKRGFMFRYFNGIMKLITSSWQMFFVGVLFGIGFDTASEVAILSMSAVFASTGRPLIDVMILPLVFSSGMVLLDSTDGVVMQYAYSWAFLNPVRKIFYNISITSISVFLAFGIGTLEWLQVIGAEYNLKGQPWDFFNNVSFAMLGGIIAGILASAWLLSLAVYKFSRVEERYNIDDIE
ncbi:MAG: HoxN/HupN/NixA family nickel/cobalt transporter [bacterium]